MRMTWPSSASGSPTCSLQAARLAGENRDDVWDKYFVSGELVEKVYAVMFMPEPKKVKWEV